MDREIELSPAINVNERKNAGFCELESTFRGRYRQVMNFLRAFILRSTACFLVVHPLPLFSEPASSLPEAAVSEVAEMVAAAGGLDLDDDGSKGVVEVEGWKGFPTTLSSYHKKDQDGMVKMAKVIMLNPSPRQAARWIVQAVIDATGTYNSEKAKTLVGVTVGVSGFQFVIRGVHWEDMERSGTYIAYPFRDGVTVKLKRFGDSYPSKALTPEEIQYTLEAAEAEVTLTGKYARIQSTTRADYAAAGGTEPTEGHAWRKVVRELYQAAWGKDRNQLMTAKAKALFRADKR